MDGDFEKLIGHDKYKDTLIDFITFRCFGKLNKTDVVAMAQQIRAGKMSSSDALSLISDKIPAQKRNDEYNAARSQARINDIAKYEGLMQDVKTYLDVGCGDGTITAAIGKHLRLKKDAIIGVDVDAWAGHSHGDETSQDIDFRPIKTSGTIPVESNTIDFVTANMVFHHIPDDDLIKTLDDINRCMKDGAILFLREHDSPNHMIDSLVNIEHGIFEVAIEKLSDVKKFQESYFGRYKSSRDWIQLLSMFGFEQIGDIIARPKGTRPFIAAFRKNKNAELLTQMTTANTRFIARNMGIKSTSSLSSNAVKRAIVQGRRK